MPAKSNVWNHYLKDKRRFADLFNGIFFKGQQKIQADTLLNASEVYENAEAEKLSSGKRGKRQERIRDVKMLMQSGACLRILAVENQNLTDYTMPFRCMQYDTMEYGRQVEQLRHKNEKSQDYANEEERLCRFKKSDKLTPVYTLCFYHGEKPWDGPKSLRDMMECGADSDEMGEYFADYPLRLYCLNEETDFTVFHTELRQLFQILQYRKNRAGLKQILKDDPEYQRMDADTLEVVSVTLNAPGIWKEREKYMNIDSDVGREEYNMCQALQEWAEEERGIGMELGIQQGIQQGIQVFMKMCHEFGVSCEDAIRRIKQEFSLSEEDAQEYINKYWDAK